jgi:serine/threonine-protein kinase
VRRDGVVVPSEAFGTPLPVDPGSYTIEASATGYRTWSTRIEVRKPGEVILVAVPRLVAVPAATSHDPVPAAADHDPPHRRRLLGLGVGAGGVALVGLAVGFGLEARSKWGSVGMHCDANHLCDAEGVSINHDARLFGNAGTIVGGIGLAALITGAVLYVTAPAARPIIEHARVEVSENARVQIGFGGRF